jgi:hypothetical protein
MLGLDQGDAVSLRIEKDKLIIERAGESVTRDLTEQKGLVACRSKRRACPTRRTGALTDSTDGTALGAVSEEAPARGWRIECNLCRTRRRWSAPDRAKASAPSRSCGRRTLAAALPEHRCPDGPQ